MNVRWARGPNCYSPFAANNFFKCCDRLGECDPATLDGKA